MENVLLVESRQIHFEVSFVREHIFKEGGVWRLKVFNRGPTA
jgi:hypothetical protein